MVCGQRPLLSIDTSHPMEDSRQYRIETIKNASKGGNISLILTKDKAPNTDLLGEIPLFLSNVSEHYFENGLSVTGRLGNMKVNVNEHRVKIGDASLCKYYLGDNLKQMSRSDVKNAFQKLSDEAHLPLSNAEIKSFEYGKNIITKHQPRTYFRYLGNKPHSNRFEQKNSLYYSQNSTQFIGYDKILEYKKGGGIVPILYQNCYLLRLEKRYQKNVARYFNCASITASMLYDEIFYTSIIKDWYNDYQKIHKIQLIKIDFDMINTVTKYKLLGVLELIKLQGGELEAITNLNEAFKKGEITKKQKHDLHQLIKEATNNKLYTKQSDEILELNQKVKEKIGRAHV